MGKGKAKLAKVNNHHKKKKKSVIQQFFERPKNHFKYYKRKGKEPPPPPPQASHYIHRLPPLMKPYQGPVEWMSQDEASSSTTTTIPSALIQHYFHVQALQQLDKELEGFANYVRLTEIEQQLRAYFVNEMQETCHRLFFGPSSFCNAPPIEVKVFGSFATPTVCTFCSDVDMAIWGVVPTFLEAQDVQTKKAPPPRPPSPQPAASPHASRLEKWRKALEAVDRENSMTPTEDDGNDIDDPHDDDDDDDDDDTADPLESFHAQPSFDDDDSDIQVGFFRPPMLHNRTPPKLTGRTRLEVVKCLESLSKSLRRNKQLIRNVQLIKTARVPIVKLTTQLHFESDVAVGGHNGTDTSLYAKQQSERYTSFAPVVLFLKMALHEQELDQPFTGGLGSYKLYVLVAYHIQEHLKAGGTEGLGEILVSFLYRYSNMRNGKWKKSALATTTLTVRSIIRDDHGGEADLSNVFLLDRVVTFFGNLWQRLESVLHTPNTKQHYLREPKIPKNILTILINRDRLVGLRQTALANAEQKRGTILGTASDAKIVKASPPPASGKRKRELVFDATSDGNVAKSSRTHAASANLGNIPRERTADELMKGYAHHNS